jgi:DNA-3-methyladenine glycosylase I
MPKKCVRCWNTTDPLYIRYHDEEWGTPLHDDEKLFELLILEGFQAGLSWELILKRREALRKAFSGFDPEKIAKYTDRDVARLMSNSEVIRNRAKILATINNARRFKDITKTYGSFDSFIWSFVGGKPVDHALKDFSKMPSESEESRAMSKELQKRGFKFVGPTICYSFIQSAGLVNDHLVCCFRYKEIKKLTRGNKKRKAPSQARAI